MRISRWPVLLCGWMLAVVGQTANAFDPPYENSFSPGMYVGDEGEGAGLFGASSDYEGLDGAEGLAFQPVQYVNDGSGAMPTYGGGDPYYMQGGYPPNAWPGAEGISPYSQHNMEGVYNDGGIWRYEVNDDDRKHVFSSEFLIVWGLRPGSHIIGDSQFTNVTFSQGLESNRSQPSLAFPRQNSSQFSNLTHYGLKLRYGWENPDQSGMMLSGFYVAPREAVKGPGVFFNGNVNSLKPAASIVYSDGAGGNIALFDEAFSQTYDQEVWGADLDAYAAPFFRRPSFKMQATLGAKYLRINETYAVRGYAGEFGYVVTGATIAPGTVVSLNQPPLNTEINSSVTSNLIGPQIGLRYDLGGEKFKIWGQTKVAVVANIENMKVFGRNAYPDSVILAPGLAGALPTTSQNVTFNNKRLNTHISPIFDQSVYGEFPLFAMIPVVNRWSFINQANFRIGYNLLLVDGMQRPASQIVYTVNDPGIRTNRTWFTLSTLSFSADWRF